MFKQRKKTYWTIQRGHPNRSMSTGGWCLSWSPMGRWSSEDTPDQPASVDKFHWRGPAKERRDKFSKAQQQRKQNLQKLNVRKTKEWCTGGETASSGKTNVEATFSFQLTNLTDWQRQSKVDPGFLAIEAIQANKTLLCHVGFIIVNVYTHTHINLVIN